jgi:hypothetical protein
MPALRLLARILDPCLSDKQYYALQFLVHHKRWPDLNHPSTFNEKLQWLKLHYRDITIKECTDKRAVRSFVAQRVGKRYLVPLLGAYERADDVDFDALPSRFVLKVSHGSQWNILCSDKRILDRKAVKERLSAWLDKDYWSFGREWAYKGLKPCILCEEFISSDGHEPPPDFKFFCVQGEAKYIQVDYDRFTHHTRALYDTEWNRLPCTLHYPAHAASSPRPECLDEMANVAMKLARNFPFVRADLYQVRHQVLFGELTFYPGRGLESFYPGKYDRVFGDCLDLSRLCYLKTASPGKGSSQNGA